MRVTAKVVGRINIPKDSCVVLDHVQVRGEDYSCRKLMQFCTIGSRLEDCCFDKTEIMHAQFGSGREMSEFIGCSFNSARMTSGGGHTRFVRCSFRDVDLRNWVFCQSTELVDCVFSGRLRKAIFFGTIPIAEERAFLGRERNEFHGNDFSAMKLFDVDFRGGIDLSQQVMPTGPEYLYLADAATTVERARNGLRDWQKGHELQRVALIIVSGLERMVREGQRQLFLRRDDYYSLSDSLPRDAIDKVFSLLRGGSDADG